MSTKKQNKSDSSEGFYLEKPEQILTDLDPHLQDVLLAAQAGENLDPSFTGQEFEDGPMVVECIAKLRDPDQEVPGLTVNRKIGQIVTGTVEVNQIETVRNHPNTISLKRATELHLELEYSVGEIQAAAQQLRDGLPSVSPAIDGLGIIVGIVDYGCDFVHDNFRNQDGSTRLLYLWDQGGPRTRISPDGYGYGREFSAARINQALAADNPYEALRYGPSPEAHGTHVMDIAAGNGRATGWPGVAPKADLIFVQVAASDIGEEDSFGNSRHLLEAVDYIFSKAREANKQAVVNLSLGTHGGPHDGSTLVEQGFDTLLQEPGRAIVIAAGNSWRRASHASGTIPPGGVRTVGWQIVAGDTTGNEMEVWYSGNDRLEVSLVTPGGQRLGPIPAGQTLNLKRQQERIGRIIHRQNDPNNEDNQIDILFKNNLVGDWSVELHNVGAAPTSFHAWIERDDRGQSGFAAADDDRTHTLGSISCGQYTVVVGAYDDRQPGVQPLTRFTSEGPTRDGRQKPEISAPGQNVVAARSLTQGSIDKSGTSMAAPHVTGAIALLMQAAGKPLPGEDIRRVLLTTIRNNPPAGIGWHSRYGSGRIDCLACLLTQFDRVTSGRSLVPVGSVASRLPVPANHANAVAAGDLFVLLAQAAAHSNVRFRVQVEVEPA
jgi:subtilisin family serine protease